MLRSATLCLCLAVFLSLAYGKIALDGLHALPSGEDYGIELDSLFPATQVVSLCGSRLPIYEILREGTVIGDWSDTLHVDVPAGVQALYVWLDVDFHGPDLQLPIPRLLAPDQSITDGGYGTCHLDDPAAGQYVVEILFGSGTINYRIGTGPHFWDVYPPEDYSAILDLHCFTLMLFRGLPTPHSDYDFQRLQQMLNTGGGLGIFYDGAEPIALKPIIHTKDFAKQGASITINLPGRVTYSLPKPESKQPLIWQTAPTDDEGMYYYEAEFRRPLNFVAYETQSGNLMNRSWAMVRNLRLIEFVRGEGYRISDIGTLASGMANSLNRGMTLPYFESRRMLDESLRNDALAAGMTAQESESFFTKYGWSARVLADASKTHCPVALYRIEGEDYDALFPMQTDPKPAEQRRVLWVWSILPESANPNRAVHPGAADSQTPQANRIAGSLHEYGFFRETYGGDALDEMTEWGWNFCDEELFDVTNNAGSAEQILFSTWGESPLASVLLAGVAQVQGGNTCAILPDDLTDVVLSGDDDTHAQDPNSPFFEGSFPPVVVARHEQAGGQLVGMADLDFFEDVADNHLFMNNVINWLESGLTGHGPDIDMPVAVVENTLAENSTGTTHFVVYNSGDAPLIFSTELPAEGWVSVTGPEQATLVPGDSVVYTLSWTSEQMPPGYHTTQWTFNSNDANESVLNWPVRLHVLGGSGVAPGSGNTLPQRFEILESYPNPFNAEITLSFTVPRQGSVVFDLFNVLGQHTERVQVQEWSTGRHQIHLDFTTKPAGLYFLRAEFAGTVVVRKLMLLK